MRKGEGRMKTEEKEEKKKRMTERERSDLKFGNHLKRNICLFELFFL